MSRSFRNRALNVCGGLLLLTGGALARAEAVCARATITLRKGPSPKTAVSWKVTKNMPFIKLEKRNGWIKLQDMEGEVHWAKPTDVTSKIRCVAVKSTIAPLYRQPSTSGSAADLKTLDRYTPLERMSDQREWMQVRDEAGHLAWIHESHVWKPVTVNSFNF